MKTSIAFLGAIILSTTHLTAAPIVGVTATTDMGNDDPTAKLVKTTDGSGLSSYSLTATHDGTTPFNSWISTSSLTGTITFDLGSTVFIDSFSFWNQNGGGPGPGITGIRDVTVLTSLDGTLFTPLPGGPSIFAQVTGTSNLPPEIFTFPPVLARDVRFAVTSNYGNTFTTGFAEVMFDSTVPEPSLLALIGCWIAGFMTLARKSRRA